MTTAIEFLTGLFTTKRAATDPAKVTGQDLAPPMGQTRADQRGGAVDYAAPAAPEPAATGAGQLDGETVDTLRGAGLAAAMEAEILEDTELMRRVAALPTAGRRLWAQRVATRLRDGERLAGVGWRALGDVRRLDHNWGAHTASAPAVPSGADDSDGWPEGCIEPMPCPTCGEWLSWQDMAGRWRCPRCDAAALERAVRWMENAARLRAVAPAVEPWPTEAAEFCLRLAPDDLPPTPFPLAERTTIHDKERFLQYIKQCIRLRTASEGEREDIIALRQVALEWAGVAGSSQEEPVEK